MADIFSTIFKIASEVLTLLYKIFMIFLCYVIPGAIVIYLIWFLYNLLRKEKNLKATDLNNPMSSLKELKAKRNKLLKLAKIRVTGKSEEMEKKRILKEIRALEHPGSVAAKASLLKFGKRAGRFFKKRAAIITENLNRMAEEQEKEKKRKRKGKKKRSSQSSKRGMFS